MSAASRASRTGPSNPCRRATPCQATASSTQREITVLIAAPASPRCRPKISSGSTAAVTMAANSVVFIARRGSPAARSTPDRQMPGPEQRQRRRGDLQEHVGQLRGSGRPRPACPGSGRANTTVPAPTTSRDQLGEQHARGCQMPRLRDRPGAERARDHRGDADGQPERDRELKKADHAGKPDRRRDRLVAQPGDVEQVHQIDGEHRHQADRPGARHHGDMAHDRSGDEARRTARLG